MIGAYFSNTSLSLLQEAMHIDSKAEYRDWGWYIPSSFYSVDKLNVKL